MKKMFPIATAFILCLYISNTFAHGTQATNEERNSAEIPTSIWERILSSADAAMTMTIKGNYHYIKSDGLADHSTGQFPTRGNPHTIQQQNITYRVPLNPKKSSGSRSIGHAAFGVAINGVPFDPATAEYWQNDRRWNIEAITGGINLGLDNSNAHVQPNGAYHYHGRPNGIINRYSYKNKPILIGYAADGFPIYTPHGYKDANNPSSAVVKLKSSYKVKSGTRPDGPGGRYDGTYTRDHEYVSRSGDLDSCNGRTGVTPEYPNGTYYYVITDEFPQIPRCWSGNNPDSSFQKSAQGGGRNAIQSGPSSGGRPQRGGMPGSFGQNRPMQGGSNMNSGRQGPPPEAFSACEKRAEGSSCEVDTPRGKLQGNCRMMREASLVCVPANHSQGPPPR